MRIKRLTLAILAATALSSCGDKKSSSGTTLAQPTQPSKNDGLMWLACVDINQNWTCDDADQSQWINTVGETGMYLEGFHTLLEQRDSNNQRLRLLFSKNSNVTANSTRDAVLALSNQTLSTDTVDDDTLSESYNKAMENGYLPVPALVSVSTESQLQGTASPNIDAPLHRLGEIEPLAQWYSTDPSDTRRQLSAQGELVLNNTDSNRLYLFNGGEEQVNHQEIDLIPLDANTLAKTNRWQRKALNLARKSLDIMVDTVSAATAINGEISNGSPVVLNPGQGVTSAHVINDGNEALILMNMLDGRYTEDSCEQGSAVSEGIFRVSLSDSSSYQLMEHLPSCIHSGFSLLTSNSNGSKYAAWDSDAKRLWLFTDNQKTALIDLKLDQPVQSLALTPGGHYLVAVAFGQAVVVNVSTGKVLHTFSGSWGNVVDSSFANGGRSFIIASNNEIHTLHLNTALQLVKQKKVVLAGSDENIKSLNVVTGGDSYFSISNQTIHWIRTDGKRLAEHKLPHGINVQKSTATSNQLVILGRGSQDMKFELIRYPLSLPNLAFTNLSKAEQ